MHSMFKTFLTGLAVVCCFAATVHADLEFDQNVTPDIIFGSGNLNGAFTVERESGVEVGLRAKLRHNAAGAPENTFNSNGDGTYTFEAGVAPTQSSPTAVWSFEWSINSDYDGTSSLKLIDLTYSLSMTSTNGVSIPAFDPINDINPGSGTVLWDHAIGDNTTGNGGGTSAGSVGQYNTLITNNNVAQNSWKPHWFVAGFNPVVAGEYTFVLTASDGGGEVASTQMTVIVVPEPGAAVVLAMVAGLGLIRRRRR